MQSLYTFFLKRLFVILFIVLESISLFLIVRYNNTQRTSFLNSTQAFIAYINTKVYNIERYFSLKELNEKLVLENEALKNRLKENYKLNSIKSTYLVDSAFQQQYQYIAAKIVYSEVFKSNNYLNINAGKKQGVEVGDALISSEGIVGVVKSVSEQFSLVIPVINTNFRGSGRIQSNAYYGSVSWEAQSYKIAQLNDIPINAHLQKGDSVLTSGFSSIFPTGIPIGTIRSFEQKKGESFYTIYLDLAVDFKKLEQIYVVKNLLKKDMLLDN